LSKLNLLEKSNFWWKRIFFKYSLWRHNY